MSFSQLVKIIYIKQIFITILMTTLILLLGIEQGNCGFYFDDNSSLFIIDWPKWQSNSNLISLNWSNVFKFSGLGIFGLSKRKLVIVEDVTYFYIL